MLLVSANADSQHINYKLMATHLEVKERGLTLVQADLPFPVQVDDSNWQFGKSSLSCLTVQSPFAAC